MPVKVIVLDFDGVIVESNKIKHQAFSELFSGFPEHNEIMSYHLSHNAVNRHAKFRHIIENILKKKYDEKLAKKWALKFSELTRDKIIKCPYVDGAVDFIDYFSNRYPLYIASATPLDELKIILEGRGISQYFKGVYGAPMPKTEMLRDIAQKESAVPKEILYIGDSREDYETSSELGCVFIARISGHDFNAPEVKNFKNMSEIKTYITDYLME